MRVLVTKIKNYLKENLENEKYLHSISSAKEAVNLARFYGVDEKKAYIAGLLHDCAKEMLDYDIVKILNKEKIMLDEITLSNDSLLHAKVGAIIARRYFLIDDIDILNAIEFHTTGRASMSMLEKIVFIADKTEELRDYEGVKDLRFLAYENLDEAIVLSIEQTINLLIKKKKLIHEDAIKTRNDLINKKD